MKSDYRKTLYTIVITGLSFGLNYAISFFLTPYIINNVGPEAYGFVSLAKNIAMYATYVTIIINSYSSRFISIEYHRGNMEKAKTYFSSVFWGDAILGGLLFTASILGIAFLEKILNIPQNLVRDVKLLFFFIFLRFFIVTVMSAFNTSAYVKNKLDITGVCKGISYIVEALVLIILFILYKPKVYFVGIGLTAAAVTVALSDYWICKRNTPSLKPELRSFRMEAVKDLVANGIWSSVSSLGNVLNSGLDLLICNLLLTPLAMGQLAVTDTINAIYLGLYTMVAETFKPGLLKIYSEGDKSALIKELKTASCFTGYMAGVIFAGFYALGEIYYKLWIPGQDIKLIYLLTIIVLGSGLLIGIEYPFFFIYTLTLTRRVSCIFTLVTGVMNVISMIVLIKFFHMGLFAVVGTTLVLQTIIHLIPHPLYMAHVLKVPWYTFYGSILKNLASCMLMCIVFTLMKNIYIPHTWISLIGTIFLYAFIGVIIQIFVMGTEKNIKEGFV